MNDRDMAVIRRIEGVFPVTVTPEKEGIRLEFTGILEKFNLSTANDEFVIYTDSWHEHFADMDQLVAFLNGLFSGMIQIVVKFRGKTPVGHQVQLLEKGKVHVVSRTGALIPLFWRSKSYKTLKYTTTQKAIEPNEDSGGH